MNRHFVKSLLVLLFAADAKAQLLSCGQTNECISIAGEIHMDSPILPISRHERFRLITDGKCWRVWITNQETDLHSLGREYATDGQTVYSVSSINTNYSGPIEVFTGKGVIKTNAVPGRSRNNASAQLWSGYMPDHVFPIDSLWLTYLSGCELKRREANSNFELPVYYGGPGIEHFDDYSEPARWKLAAQFPFCPKQLEFFGGGIYGWSKDKGWLRRMPSSPITNMSFVAERMTNSGGWTVPASFKFVSPMQSVKGELISIERIPHPSSFLPTVYPATYVDDRRLDPEKPKSYEISERWLTAEEAKKEWRRQRGGR